MNTLIIILKFLPYHTCNIPEICLESYRWRRSERGLNLSQKREMVVKHVFTKLYTLPKACF